MIDAYTWTTPNGYKLLIALEEMALPYAVHWVNITRNEQHKPEFLAVNPNAKIPAIVDHDGPDGLPIAVFESAAVLIYLADKTRKFLAPSGADRYAALEWMMFNVGGTGPNFGQLGHFLKFAPEKVPYAIERFTKEAERLLRVLDGRLAEEAFLAGADYSIADMINVSWARAASSFLGLDLAPHRHLTRWLVAVEARPAVARAIAMKPSP
jgi:GSH-dependent disulfide-bond oxidoreductase